VQIHDFREAGAGGLGNNALHRRSLRPIGIMHTPFTEETPMTWTTPQACDLRFGFEITMYIAAK
jgi:pyrroloquinoline quinone biosynthesis protein A